MAKNKRKGLLIKILIIIITYIGVWFLAFTLGGNTSSIILSLFGLTVLIITIWGGHYLLIIRPRLREKITKQVAEITPEESKNLDLQYLLKEYGIIPKEIILDTPKPVGEEGEEKQLWHWLRFKDRFDNFFVDVFRNMSNIEQRAIHFKLTKEQAQIELTSLGSPLKQRQTIIQKIYDQNTGAISRIIEEPLPAPFYIKKEIEEPPTIVKPDDDTEDK